MTVESRKMIRNFTMDRGPEEVVIREVVFAEFSFVLLFMSVTFGYNEIGSAFE